MRNPAVACVTFALVLGLTGAALAQSATAPSPQETRRQAVFAQLLANPDDRALMLDYARLSVQARDFEGAVATLERLVALEPANAAARVELAVAYFALGANGIAQYHLGVAEASGALSPAQAADVARYRGEAESRDAPNRVAGRLSFGRSWTRSQTDDSGPVASGALEWRADMGGRNAEDWLTQLSVSRFAPGEQSLGQRQVARLRTGPEFRLTGDAFGPRLQPYLELSALRDDADRDYDAIAVGFAYQNPHTAMLTSFADVQIGRGHGTDALTADFDYHEIALGIAVRPSRDTRIRATLGHREEDREGAAATSRETTRTLRLDALHTFDIGIDALPRRWEATANAARVEVDEKADIFGLVTDYTDTSYGAGLRAFVTEDLFIETRGSRLRRVSATGQPTQTRTVYSVQIGWEF